MAKADSKATPKAAPTLTTDQRLSALEAKLAELEARLNRVSA